jgi:DNA mismatch repair protein MutS2
VDVSSATLEALEWPAVVERLRAHLRTPGGLRLCAREGGTALFAADLETARARHEEASEARAVLAAAAPPFGGLVDVVPALLRAERGGSLGAGELLDVGAVVDAVASTIRFLDRNAGAAPRLAAVGSGLGDHRALADAIGAVLDSEGQIRDAASPTLAEARAEARRLAAEIRRRLDSALHDPAIAPHLSDAFVTVRNDRFVLPVRADARGRVRGIVHDASASGTTLFVEPQAVVDANNHLKKAELRIERETARILRELTDRVGREGPELRASLDGLVHIDLAFARAGLAAEWNAVPPIQEDAGVYELPQLRHPLLEPGRAVPNDVRLGADFCVLVLSGPNAGGKTVLLKAVALATLCAHAGIAVPAGAGARVDWTERVRADIGDSQSLRESLSTFSAHLASLARIVDEADPHSLVVLDEVGDGTDPGEGAALAQAVLEALASAGARVVATTHYGLLKEMAAVDPRFENASFEFDDETLAPTYRMRTGAAGASSATAVAARMGLRRDVLERANALLEREDRRLERTLAELAASRLALERERREVERARVATELERAEAAGERARLQQRLERLQARRDALYAEMRRELEGAFRAAHEEVAGVIRTLQRQPDARQAQRAHETLRVLEARTAAAVPSAPPAPRAAPLEAPDWRRARAGDRVAVAGGGTGVLMALPDRRGRVVVQVGGARVVMPVDAVGRPPGPAPAAGGARVALDAGLEARGGAERCDLRGLRVDEALAQLVRALDRATLAGRERLEVVHGIGTGALRDAVRSHLATSPYVARFAAADPESGGEGVTRVELAG